MSRDSYTFVVPVSIPDHSVLQRGGVLSAEKKRSQDSGIQVGLPSSRRTLFDEKDTNPAQTRVDCSFPGCATACAGGLE
jgi:hypothetical protein